MGIVAEILVIVYLSSLSNLLKIIMKYVSLAAVIKFDNFYAATLYNHAIQAAPGTKLYITERRSHRYRRAKMKKNAKKDNHYKRITDDEI